MQSKRASMIEAWTNTLVGFAVSYLINMLLMPALGHPITHAQNFIIVLVFLVASFVRSYGLRRLFNFLQYRRAK